LEQKLRGINCRLISKKARWQPGLTLEEELIESIAKRPYLENLRFLIGWRLTFNADYSTSKADTFLFSAHRVDSIKIAVEESCCFSWNQMAALVGAGSSPTLIGGYLGE
jgi:hypothetical protein